MASRQRQRTTIKTSTKTKTENLQRRRPRSSSKSDTVQSVIKKAKKQAKEEKCTAVNVLENMLKDKWLSADRRKLLETALWLIRPLMRTASSSKGPRPPKKPTSPDPAVSALSFYMCWRFRKEENPAFQFLNKDTTLLICTFVRLQTHL